MHKDLIKLSISTILSVFSYTLVFPVMTASLVARGFSGTAIGVMAAVVYLSIFAAGPVVPKFIRKFGGQKSYSLGKLALLAGFFILPWSDSYTVWFCANVCLGIGAAVTWPLTEGAIARFAPAEKKGAAAGIFQTGLGLALAGGPLVASVCTLEKSWIFISAGLIALFSWIPAIRFPWPDEHKIKQESAHRLHFRSVLVSGLVIAAFMGGLFENGLSSILIAVGSHLGLKTSQAIALAGVIGTGSFLGPYPVGRLADAFGVHRVLNGSLLLMSASMGALFFVPQWLPLIWILAFLWGVIGAGLYTLSLTTVAVSFQGPLVLSATTLMISIYTMGAFSGPFLGGLAFDISKDFGLPSVFIFLSILSVVAQLYFRRTVNKFSLSQFRIKR